jgi:hypothetical protein
MFDANVSALEAMGVNVLGLGIVSGLALSAGASLTLNISAGMICGRKVQSFAATTWTVPANQTSYIWMDDSGNFTASTTSAHPGGNVVCLGQVVATTSITAVSTVNRMDGWSWVTPFVLSLGAGLFEVDVQNRFVRLQELRGNGAPIACGFADLTGSKTNADYTLATTEAECQWVRLNWSGWTAGHNVVVPTIAGAIWDITNLTGQIATIKTASGTGIAIGAGKSARVACDGVNIIRLTADC